MTTWLWVGLAAVLAGASPAVEEDVILRVGGKTPKAVALDAEGFAKLPRTTVKTADRDGKAVEYEGVTFFELLRAAGLNLTPDELRGEALEFYVVVEAADGYRALFALPELAPSFTDRVVIVADRRDGKPLKENEGPLRVVATGEKRQARWVRQVIGLKVGRD